jgi:hypothetical protein
VFPRLIHFPKLFGGVPKPTAWMLPNHRLTAKHSRRLPHFIHSSAESPFPLDLTGKIAIIRPQPWSIKRKAPFLERIA